MNIKYNENMLFLVDTNEWRLDDISKFLEMLDVVFPYSNIAFLPKTMALHNTRISKEEYEVINNVLKRMMEKTDEN